MMTSQSKWEKQKLEKRTILRSLERQISVKEFQDKGKHQQQAKDWIAKHEPQIVQEAKQGQQAIHKYKRLVETLEAEKRPRHIHIRAERSQDNGMGR